MSHCQGEENLGEIIGQGMKEDTATVTADTEQDHDLQEDTDRLWKWSGCVYTWKAHRQPNSVVYDYNYCKINVTLKVDVVTNSFSEKNILIQQKF